MTFEYGESSGPLILDARNAVERSSLFPEPTASITTGDVKGIVLITNCLKILLPISRCSGKVGHAYRRSN